MNTERNFWKSAELERTKLEDTFVSYRDRNKKELAWRRVSEVVGVSVEVCKKRWKNLRDTYEVLKILPPPHKGLRNLNPVPYHATHMGHNEKPAEDPTALLMAIVNPDETPSEDTQLGSASSAPSTRSASPAPSSNNPPSSPTPSSSSSRHNTPTPRKRKRTDSQRILDFLQAESDKEQRRHEESEEKTLRFLSLFERMVEKL
uniref:MADF domain-containing protein n=1 Tax=Knipowitschia caucasica TaxID=637954 RepID=A0AAV2MHE6_KNICA